MGVFVGGTHLRAAGYGAAAFRFIRWRLQDMADMRKAFGWLGSRGGRLAFLAGALVLAAGAVVCCIILKNNILKGEGGVIPALR